MTAGATGVDERHLARCLELAAVHRGRTAPNPIVGCVIVGANGDVLAEGAHRGPGQLHAEADALATLGGRAPGATLYCNLEPCTHQGRTPPCVPSIVAAGIARVVFGSADPIRAHGGGAARLRRAKIAVSRGLVDACDRANRGFLVWAIDKRPAFTLKAGVTLDGKIATVAGQSKWITGEVSRADVMRQRTWHDAVVVGIGTVLADDPRLDARVPGGRDPVRVVLDGRLRTPVDARLLSTEVRTIIACSTSAPKTREKALLARGAEVWRLAEDAGRLSLAELATRLGADGMTSVLVEGGGQVHASFLAAGLADQVILYIAPVIVGGPAPSWVGGGGVASLTSAYRLAVEDVTRFGDDLRVTLGKPVSRKPEARGPKPEAPTSPLRSPSRRRGSRSRAP